MPNLNTPTKQQLIEYLQYRYCLTIEGEGIALANKALGHIFEPADATSPRQRLFEALKSLVQWAAYSRFHLENPILVELQNLREVYGDDQEQRVLDLAADLSIALKHAETHLGLSTPLMAELESLPKINPDSSAGIPLFDLELDPFWNFDYLQRSQDRKPQQPSGTPLDVFYLNKKESTDSPEPSNPGDKKESFAKTFKLPAKKLGGLLDSPLNLLLESED